MPQQYGLGRGLASLIPPRKKEEAAGTGAPSPFSLTPISRPEAGSASDAAVPTVSAPAEGATTVVSAPLGKIVPNPHQPRLAFDETKLAELAASIREHGILQPLVVTRVGEGYELIAGERRLQAAKRAGLSAVPVIVRDATEQQKLEFAVIENIQRDNLNPIEEAKAYLRLIDEFGMRQDEVAKQMGKSRSGVANTLRLLQLPVEIQRAVVEGTVSEGHAKALLAIENPEKQRAVFELIVKEELTVRETEEKARTLTVRTRIRSGVPLNPEIAAHIEHLTQILGTRVKIAPSGKGGRVVIEYYSQEELDGLLKRLEE